jgi:hypothetical protein
MKQEKQSPKIDLLIIDIDNTFLYHRTVAIANWLVVSFHSRLFQAEPPKNKMQRTGAAIWFMLKTMLTRPHRFRWDTAAAKSLLILSYSAARLYFLECVRRVSNPLGIKVSNRLIINVWAKTVVRLKLGKDEYAISAKSVKDALYKSTAFLLEELRKNNKGMKVAAISEGFMLCSASTGNRDAGRQNEPVSRLLGLDEYVSNVFYLSSNGIIDSYDIPVACNEDKKRIATGLIKQFRAKSIGIIIDDYDDLGLAELKGVCSIFAKKRLAGNMRNRSAARFLLD